MTTPPYGERINIAALDPGWRQLSLATLENHLRSLARFPALRLVVMHPAPRFWREDEDTSPARPAGEYALLIEGLRKLAAVAAESNLTIAVENNRCYWDAIPLDRRFRDTDPVRFTSLERTCVREYFGTSPWEWLQIWRDVDRENVGLCLDTSHACTYVHRIDDLEQRRKAMWDYLSEPRALRHIHWNGNILESANGREDQHLQVNSAHLGDQFNCAIRDLRGVTHLLEHYRGLESLDEELRYIAAL